jgi:hypothetical protein
LEDPDIDGVLIVDWMLKVVEWVRIDWIRVAQDWDKLRAVMNTGMRSEFHKM